MGRTRTAAVIGLASALVVLVAGPALAQAAPGAAAPAADLGKIVDNARVWVMGLLAGLATLFFVVGGARYVIAGGDPGEVERAKLTLRSAMVGYALAILAPVVLSVLKGIVGG